MESPESTEKDPNRDHANQYFFIRYELLPDKLSRPFSLENNKPNYQTERIRLHVSLWLSILI